MRFGYADPPYPGKAYLYADQPDFAGEVDHSELVRALLARGYDGWALSTSARALREVLPLCPDRARVCAWVKPQPAHVRTRGIHNLWEAVIVVDGRQLPPGVSDWLSAKPARGGAESLIGRKPLAFVAWLFDLLGMLPGDELDDWFPGTGIVGRAWRELSSRTSRDMSPAAADDASPAPTRDNVVDGRRRRVAARAGGPIGRDLMNTTRLAQSLQLLRTVNAWRLRRARWPKHVAQELAYREEQLRAHDAAADLRAIDERVDPRQLRMPWR